MVWDTWDGKTIGVVNRRQDKRSGLMRRRCAGYITRMKGGGFGRVRDSCVFGCFTLKKKGGKAV